MTKHVRPSKKKVAALKKVDPLILDKDELKRDDKLFKRITNKLSGLVKRKTIKKDYKDDVLDHKSLKKEAKQNFAKIEKKKPNSKKVNKKTSKKKRTLTKSKGKKQRS